MPLTREQKQKIIENLKEKIDKQKSVVFVAIKGVMAKDIFDLRKRLKAADCLLTVAKKTLINIAFKAKNLKIDTEKLEGEVALIFGFKDEISPAKIPYQFSLENKNLKILGGFYEDKFIEPGIINELAQIPSRENLLARFVGSIKAPVANFVNILQGNIKSLVCVLNNIKPQ